MASKRARERAEFLVTSNRGVLADIIPAVANALDQAWEDADNRVVAEREARLERDRAADKLMTDRAYHRGMTRGMRDGIEHGALAERERWKNKLNSVQAYQRGLWHGAAAERVRIARAIRKQFPAYSDEELAAGAAGGGKTVAFMIQANVSAVINAIADSIERGDL